MLAVIVGPVGRGTNSEAAVPQTFSQELTRVKYRFQEKPCRREL